MKYCNKCNLKYSEHLNFCNKCGSVLTEIDEFINENLDDTSRAESDPEINSSKRSYLSIRLKKFLRYCIIAAGLVCLFASIWVYNYFNGASYLTTSYDSINFSQSGGFIENIGVDCGRHNWEITYAPKWLDAIGGGWNHTSNDFTLSCNANESGITRYDHITIKSGKYVKQIYVSQSGQSTYLNLSTDKIKASQTGGTLSVVMSTDGILPKMTTPEFVKVGNYTESGFTITIEPNTGFSRSAPIILTSDTISKVINIYQEGRCRYCNGKTHNNDCISCKGSGYGFDIF